MITKNSRASNRPSYGLFKLKNLPFLADILFYDNLGNLTKTLRVTEDNIGIKEKNTVFNWLRNSCFIKNGEMNIYFSKLALSAKFSEWYVPINFNSLYEALYITESEDKLCNAEIETNSNLELRVKIRQTFFALNGDIVTTTPPYIVLGNMATAEVFNLKKAMPSGSKKFMIYIDSLNILNEIAQIITDGLEQFNKLYKAYTAIPVANEQFTDETVVTPNLSTETRDGFNPINAVSGNISDRTKTTQTGTSTSVTKRATGRTAKEQADIVRNIPNLFTQTMSRIASALISPQAVQDMLDFGLCNYDYIDYD